METAIDRASNFPTQDILGWTVFTLAQGQARLVDALPIDRERLINRIIGAVQARHSELLPRALNTLRALLGHTGYHSNRVWASLRRLGRLIVGKEDDSKDKGAKKAQRGIEDLVRARLVHKITEQQELLSGPGEHDFLDAGGEKKGDGPVNHYDLSPLLAYIDPQDKADWDAMFNEGRIYLTPLPAPEAPRDVDALYPNPFDNLPEQAPIHSTALVDNVDNVDNLDPFTEDYAERLNVMDFAPLPPSSFSPVVSTETTSHRPCDVETKVDKEVVEQGDGETQILPSPKIFNTTNLSNITKQIPPTRDERGGVEKQASDTLLQLLTRSRERGGRGFDVPGAQRLISDFRQPFLWEVIEYTEWMQKEKGEQYGPGWVTNAARGFEKEWPLAFRQHLAQKRAQQAKERKAAAHPATANMATAVPEGVQKPLRALWPSLIQQLRSDPSIKPAFYAMHILNLRGATLDATAEGDCVTIEAMNPFSFVQLSERHTGTFETALSTLLGRSVTVRFTPSRGRQQEGKP